MRIVVTSSLLLAGCGPPVQPSVDATIAPDAGIVDAPPPRDPRTGRAAVITGDDVVWGLIGGGCPISSGPECPPAGASLCRSDHQASDVAVEIVSQRGVLAVAADGASTFALLVSDVPSDYFVDLVRVDGTGVATLETEYAVAPALAIDGSHVYWADQGVNGVEGGIVRAARVGDGTDRELLFARPSTVTHLEIDGDWIYWLEAAPPHLWRAQPGGAPESLGDGTLGGPFTIGDGVVYAWRAGGSLRDLVAIEPEGAIRVVAAGAWVGEPLVVDGGDVFWSTGNHIWSVPAAGGEPLQIVSDPFRAFAVSADAIFHDFSSTGFRVTPRP